MTEEMIIDGINVAGCEFFDYECSAYRQEYWESEDNTKDMCSSHPNCYFKQLKRLEQENKELEELNYKTRYSRLEMYESFETECNNYRSALEEIREMLIICKEFRTCERCKFYKECNKDLEGCITDKINEVLTP